MRISECYTASSYARESGTLNEYVDSRPKGTLEIVPNIRTFPWCFIGEANLKDEVDQLDSQVNEATRILDVIAKDRHCPSWYPWREFASPREQWEESVILARDQRREKFEQQMEKDRKEFDLKLFEISQRVQSDSAEIAKRSDTFNRRITLFFIVLTILAVVGTFLSLAFPNGIPWLISLLD